MEKSSREYLINTHSVSKFLDSLQAQLLYSTQNEEDIGWEPTPPQQAVLDSPAFELLYGGAAGGGKTMAAVGIAKVQGKQVLILRRTFPELEDSIIQEAYEWYGDPKYYNQSKHVWKWGNKQRIRFGYAETMRDVYQYQSAQFDTLEVEEITQWEDESIYTYLLSRVRTTDSSQRCRVVVNSNPGGAGHSWVMARWAPWLDKNHPNPAEPGELRWFRRDEEGLDIECSPDHPDAMSRTFIPAKLEDNPYLDEDYRKRINALPEPYRTQLRDGDWTVGELSAPGQLYRAKWIDESMDRWVKPAPGNPDALGVDVARGGADKTVLAPRYDNVIDELVKIPGRLTPDGAAVAAAVVERVSGVPVLLGLDIIGVGSSPLDILVDMGYNVIPVIAQAKALNSKGEPIYDKSGMLKMRNQRSAMHWRLRDMLEDGEIDLPPDKQLRQELLAIHWHLTPSGVLLEEKKEIKKKIGRSPDSSDAVAEAVYVQPPPIRISMSEMVGG